jgi:predicted flap endonuclease-1-like 5' DNA nuclease
MHLLAERGVQAVTEHDRASIIATLERASAQLEASMADQRENETAGNAASKSRKLVREAIDHLRSIEGGYERVEARAPTDAFDKADDLTSIRGISTAFAEHLASLGVTRYAEIASWRADDVRRVAQALKLPSEFSSRNWIEQAALLERRKKGLENEMPDFPQPAIALSAGAATSVDGLSAPDATSPIDLPEIIEAICNDEPAHQETSPPPEAKPASQKPSAPGDAKADPLAAAIDERAADSASPGSIAAKPVRPNAQGARVPIVTASSPVSTDASERMRRLEEEKLRLAERLGRVGELPGDADEAAVTFVIREEAQATPPKAAPSAPRQSSPLLRRTQPDGEPEAGNAEAYVASWGSTEEAEVVVVKPVVQSRHGQVARSEAGPVRRLLKALRGS